MRVMLLWLDRAARMESEEAKSSIRSEECLLKQLRRLLMFRSKCRYGRNV